MSDDEADPELLALLAQSLGLGPKKDLPPSTGVLESVEYVYDNALDVSISSAGSKAAATLLFEQLKQRQYSTHDWAKHELHPKPSGGEATVNFIFTMNLLNFSFWSDLPEEQRFSIEYKGKRWTGYWSLVAALQRGLDEGYSITTPSSWSTFNDDEYAHIFRSATQEPMPLLSDRIHLLRTASAMDPAALIQEADHSAARLVNLLTSTLPDHFSDIASYGSRTISLYKRAQILVADLWACFRGESFGKFSDIDTALTMFADYRVPQMLQRLGVLWYSPRLGGKIRRKEVFESGEKMEVEVRACSVWAVELLRREIVRRGGGSWEVEVEEDDEDYTTPGVAEAMAVQPSGPLIVEESTGPAAQTDSVATDSNEIPMHDPPKHLPTSNQTNLDHQPPSETTTPQQPPTSTTPPAETPSLSITNPSTQPTPKRTKKTITVTLNAILLDYLLYDTAKEIEAREQQQQEQERQERRREGKPEEEKVFDPDGPKTLPHHRCRSIWY